MQALLEVEGTLLCILEAPLPFALRCLDDRPLAEKNARTPGRLGKKEVNFAFSDMICVRTLKLPSQGLNREAP
eukprot:996928-Amphidinium_carterae.1